MYNLIELGIFILLFSFLIILFITQEGKCYEYDNLGMYTIKDEIVVIREYIWKFFIYLINKENNQGYANECIDFYEAFQLEKTLKEHRRQEYIKRNRQ